MFSADCVASGCLLLQFAVFWCYHFYRTWTRFPFSVSSWQSPSVRKADPLNNGISCISPFILLTNHCQLPVQPFQLHAANQAFLCQAQDELLEIRNLARTWPSSLVYNMNRTSPRILPTWAGIHKFQHYFPLICSADCPPGNECWCHIKHYIQL